MPETYTTRDATSKGVLINEDHIGNQEGRHWILDGCTSLVGRQFQVDCEKHTDASWFVQRFSNEFAKLDNHEEIGIAISTAALAVRERIRKFAPDWLTQDMPSASFACIRILNGSFEVSNLGDCAILYSIDDGPIRSFGNSDVTALDQELLKQYSELRRQGVEHKDAAKRLYPSILKNRTLMNKPDGYSILTPDASGVSDLQVIRLKPSFSAKLVLMTDGLYRLVDHYHCLTESQIFEQSFERDGLDSLMSELRAIERSDPDCTRYPRIKFADDASAIAISWSL